MTEPLTPDDFLPHVGKAFRATSGGPALTLAQVERRPSAEWAHLPGLREPFSLIFRGPREGVLREGLYTLEVEDGPAFELYVMPIHTPQRDRQDYQSVFN